MKSKLIKLSNDISDLINKNKNKYVIRNKKTNMNDGLAYRLLYTKKESSQLSVTAKINEFMNTTINRSSYSDRDNQIDIKFYEKLSKLIPINTNKRLQYTKQIFAVDGTYGYISKKLGEDGFKLNTNKLSSSPLISGIFNVTYNYPISLDLVKHKNERKAFLDFKTNYSDYEGNIFVFDRGYYSIQFMKELHINNLSFVCRLRQNSELINHNIVDENKIINIDGIQINVRIITYMINENKYYMITNLCDNKIYPLEIIKQIYKDRWSVEEYFKYIKTYCQFDNFTETKTENIKKMICGSLIISKLVYMITQFAEITNKKINKHILTEGLYSSFILKLIYKKGFNYNYLHKFLKSYLIYYKVRENKKYSRVCNNPHKKSYMKFHKNKLVEKDIDKNKFNNNNND